MTLQEQLRADTTTAMKARETLKLEVLRSVQAALTNEAVALGRGPQGTFSDEEVLAVLKRLSKQRKDSSEQFRAGAREDLAEKEDAELLIIEAYLPEQMSEEKIREIVLAQKEKLGVEDTSKMGILIGAVVKETAGQADGSLIKSVVESLF